MLEDKTLFIAYRVEIFFYHSRMYILRIFLIVRRVVEKSWLYTFCEEIHLIGVFCFHIRIVTKLIFPPLMLISFHFQHQNHTFQCNSRKQYLNKANLEKFLAMFWLGEKRINSIEFYKMSNNKITIPALHKTRYRFFR